MDEVQEILDRLKEMENDKTTTSINEKDLMVLVLVADQVAIATKDFKLFEVAGRIAVAMDNAGRGIREGTIPVTITRQLPVKVEVNGNL